MSPFRAKTISFVLLLPLLPLFAAVDGAVTNGTTGKPQAGVTVNVMKLEGGMVPIGQATTGADGRFHIEAPPPSGQLPYLVRADYKNVGYFAPVRAGEGAVTLKVYDTTGEAAAYKLSGHQVILEPHQSQMMVLESYTISNATQPPKTYYNREGFRFAVPDNNATEMSVSATGPGQLPLRQSAESKGQGKYVLDYAFRPGDTRVEISYKLPYTDGYKFKAPLMAGLQETEIIAPSDGVTVAGPGLTLTTKDESKHAAFYSWKGSKTIELTITGALPDVAAAGDDPNAAAQTEETSTVERPSYVNETRWPVLSVLAVALALGLFHLYRTKVPDPSGKGAARASRK